MTSLPPHERRNSRRMAMGSAARILFEHAQAVEAECVELSVGGMTLRAGYVPGEGEVLLVEILCPDSGLPRPPLLARVAVRRCHSVEPGLYEIGGAIVEIVS